MQKQPRLYTVKEAALLIGVQYRQLLSSVSDGTVPHYQLKKSRRLVDPDEVLAAMQKQEANDE